MNEKLERLSALLADLWADVGDCLEDNARGSAVIFVAGLFTAAVGILVFK